MPTRPEDAAVINNHIFPAILGARRFRDVTGPATHQAFNEVAVFQALLSTLRPRSAIEVGTETGATLDIIARHSARVVSIDIDPGVKATLAPRFPNTEFLTGSSHDLLPVALQRLQEAGQPPDFIFIDGDHSEAGVRQDVEHLLSFTPTTRLVVLMHDTFNPGCRRGIYSAQWNRNPHCHYVDLDFCPGVLHPDDSCHRQMWGGLGFALFLPEPRYHRLEVKLTHQLMFEAALRSSVYLARTAGARS